MSHQICLLTRIYIGDSGSHILLFYYYASNTAVMWRRLRRGRAILKDEATIASTNRVFPRQQSQY